MRTCYVILSHTDVAHLLALVHRIRELSPDSSVLVRHDQRIAPLRAAAVADAGGVLLESRIEVRWGDWSMVEATLEAFAAAAQKFDPDLTVLISGQDWPVRPLKEWEGENRDADAVLAARRIRPRTWIWRDHERMLADRYDYSWHPLPRFWDRWPKAGRSLGAKLWYRTVERVRSPILLNRLPRDLGWTIGVRSSAFRNSQSMFKGEQWCAVSRAAVAALFRFHDENPELYSAFQRTLIPDESFIHTVLLNDRGLRTKMASVSWNRFDAKVANHPRSITVNDIAAIRSSGTPFARKVGSEQTHVRRRLDAAVDADRASSSST